MIVGEQCVQKIMICRLLLPSDQTISQRFKRIFLRCELICSPALEMIKDKKRTQLMTVRRAVPDHFTDIVHITLPDRKERLPSDQLPDELMQPGPEIVPFFAEIL